MIPVMCRVKHDPENGMYGDCLRACVATLLEKDAEDVPHFHHDNPGGIVGAARVAEYLATLGYVPFYGALDGAGSLAEILEYMGELNPNVPYLLFGSAGDCDHVVVCKGDHIAHNPAWYGSSLVGPASSGVWSIMVIVRA